MGDLLFQMDRGAVARVFEELIERVKKVLPGALREPSLPANAKELEQLLGIAYWASHEKNEGRELAFSLVLVPPDRIPDVIVFENAVQLDGESLRGLAPICQGCFGLGVIANEGGFCVWGVVLRPIPSLVIKVVEPGSLLLRLDFENVAVIDGDKCFPTGAGAPQAVGMMADGLFSTLAESRRFVLAALLLQIADSVRRHGNGGTLLITPSNDSGWMKDVTIRKPLKSFTALADKLEDYVTKLEEVLATNPPYIPKDAKHPSWYALVEVNDLNSYITGNYSAVSPDLQRIVTGLGGLTAVDGAMVLNDRLVALGYSAILDVKRSGEGFDEWTVPSMLADRGPRAISADDVGGTRHRSAAHFVATHRDSVALIISHDGPVSFVTWAVDRSRVLVIKRVELLLDWWC